MKVSSASPKCPILFAATESHFDLHTVVSARQAAYGKSVIGICKRGAINTSHRCVIPLQPIWAHQESREKKSNMCQFSVTAKTRAPIKYTSTCSERPVERQNAVKVSTRGQETGNCRRRRHLNQKRIDSFLSWTIMRRIAYEKIKLRIWYMPCTDIRPKGEKILRGQKWIRPDNRRGRM